MIHSSFRSQCLSGRYTHPLCHLLCLYDAVTVFSPYMTLSHPVVILDGERRSGRLWSESLSMVYLLLRGRGRGGIEWPW